VLLRPALAIAGLGVLAAGILAACASRGPTGPAPSSVPPSTATGSRRWTTSDETVVTPDGRTRSYRLVVPDGLRADHPSPLLVALHGGIGSGQQFERTSGFDELAVEHGFVVVYPDGIEIGGRGILRHGRVWNGGRCCSTAARENVDDVGFLATVIDRVSATRRIDPERVFAAGHSNGAIMSYRLACELADRIAAIGVQAGSIEIEDCAPTRPVSVLAIHGTADTNIPIEGGRGSGLAGIAFSSPTDAAARFAAFDGCAAPTTHTDPGNRDVTVRTWPGGRRGTEVQFVTVRGAPHAWMGHPSPRGAAAGANRPYADFDSSAAIWAFLAAHPQR
jgi:polyhydroxybutyrate depolymerase